nr:hypothetical protein [Tanacetum cinerariifolium]GEX55506.1 hypothetical protein [Tanacetum cinerariifolium]
MRFSLSLEILGTLEIYTTLLTEKTPKPKYVQKKADSDTSTKKKPDQVTKGTRLKSSAKVAKSYKQKQHTTMPKTKGLVVLSEVALTEAGQIKLATKRSKKDFHISHASGSGDGVDTQSKVPDEQQQKTFSQDEDDDDDDDKETYVNDDSEETKFDNDGDDLTHPNLSTYKANDEEEEEEKAYDEEVSSDQRVSTTPEYELTKEEENKEGDDEDIEGEQEQDEEDDMYRDVNINLERSDAEMTNAQANHDKEDTHGTLINVPPVSKTLVNVPVSVAAKTPSSDTTTPQPPIPIIQPLQQTPKSIITTTNIPTITLPGIYNFASLFQFDQWVSALETEMSEFRQNNQFVKAISSIMGIVDNYLASKMKEAVDVQAQVSKIMPKIEKYVIESLGAKVLVRSTNQPQTSYTVAASLSEFELKKILIDKIEENKSINISDIQKNLFNALVELYNSDKDIITSYGDVVTLKIRKDDQDKDKSPLLDQNEGQREGDQAKKLSHQKNQHIRSPSLQVLQKVHLDLNQNLQASPTYDLIKGTCKSVVELEYHLEEVFKATNDRLDWHNPEGKPCPRDLSKPPLLILNERGHQSLEEIIIRKQDDKLYKFREGDFKRLRRQDIEDMLLFLVQDKLSNLNLKERYALNVALRMFTRRIVIQECVEDLQLGVKSYQKNINLKKPDTYRSDLRRMTLYTAYSDIQGIINKDEINRNRLMHTDELYMFSACTLNHVRTSLNDIATGIEMDYLPKRN